MTAHVPRLPFSLHALVAEARRRARRRRVLTAVAVIALGGGVGGALYATHASGGVAPSATAVDYQPGWLVYPASLPATIGPSVPELTVSASSRGAAWIVGADVAWQWDGSAWRDVPLPSGSYLSSVASIGPDEAWAVGRDPLIEHWTGTRWTVVPIADSLAGTPRLSAVSAAGPHDVWAAGVISTAKQDKWFWHKAQPLLLHWDGVAWRSQALPWARTEMRIQTVVATGPSSVWVVPEESGQSVPEQPVLEHWDGSRWQAVPAPFGSNDPLLGFSARSGSDAWAVGSFRTGESARMRTHPLAAHWDGSSWTFTAIPVLPGDNDMLLGSVAGGAGEAWAIGQVQPVIPDTAVAPKLVFLHWTGSSWTVSPGPVPSWWFGSLTITAAPDGTAWAIENCGGDNDVLSWNGTRWTAVPHPPDLQSRLSGGPLPAGRITSCASAGSSG